MGLNEQDKNIDEADVQQDSPAEAISEVTDPDGQVDDDLAANRIIVAPGAQGGAAVPIVTKE